MNHPFVTCDLLDAHLDNSKQNNAYTTQVHVLSPVVDGLAWRQFGAVNAFGGQAVTVKCHEDNSRVKELLATDGAGKVLVVDGGGSLRCALMGDMIAESAVKHGWAGVIIYGAVRDVDALSQMHLGVIALAATPQKSTRKGVGETEVQLNFGGVTIRQGDQIYADNNGILVASTALI